MRTHAGGVSDPGRVRSHNEDYFEWREPEARAGQTWRALYVVADGVGGAAAGDEASRRAVEAFVEAFYASSATSTEEALRAAMVQANAAVFESAQQDGRATTLVAAAVVGDVLQVANVGDSRLYLVRAGQIRQITRDHSWVQEQVRAGRLAPEDAGTHPRRNVITRWLGQRSVEPDLFGVELEVGDRILLTTDGLCRHVSDDTIGDAVCRQDAQSAAEHLTRLANAGGGSDNVTIVVVHVEDDSAQPAGTSRVGSALPAAGAQPAAKVGRATGRAPRLASPPAAHDAPRQPTSPAAAPRPRLPGWAAWAILGAVVVLVAAAGVFLVADGADGAASVPGAPVAIAVGPDRAVYVTDQASGEVVVYPPGELSGLPVRLLGFAPKPIARWRAVEDGAAPPVLSGLAVGPDGTVFVADVGADRIRAFDSRGQLLAAWGQSGAGLGQLTRPASLAVGPTGQVYVADVGNGRVERFDARGTVQASWSGEGLPEASVGEISGLAVDARGNLFVAQGANGRLIELDSEGRLVGFWTGQELGGIARLTGLASRDGTLFVTDPDLRRVWTLTPTGVEGAPWRATWREAGRLQSPAGVAPDPRGDLYVLDSRGGGVLVLRRR